MMRATTIRPLERLRGEFLATLLRELRVGERGPGDQLESIMYQRDNGEPGVGFALVQTPARAFDGELATGHRCCAGIEREAGRLEFAVAVNQPAGRVDIHAERPGVLAVLVDAPRVAHVPGFGVDGVVACGHGRRSREGGGREKRGGAQDGGRELHIEDRFSCWFLWKREG
jgi:hypothetical protein